MVYAGKPKYKKEKRHIFDHIFHVMLNANTFLIHEKQMCGVVSMHEVHIYYTVSTQASLTSHRAQMNLVKISFVQLSLFKDITHQHSLCTIKEELTHIFTQQEHSVSMCTHTLGHTNEGQFHHESKYTSVRGFS